MQSALNLILFAESEMIGGEIFIANMGAASIMDIARALNSGEMPEHKIVGMQVGEKAYEELVTDAEAARSYLHENYIVILPEGIADTLCSPTKALTERYHVQADFPNGLKSDVNLMSWEQLSELIH